MRRRSLASSIEDSLIRIPTVVCRIVADFVYERPHRWLDDDGRFAVYGDDEPAVSVVRYSNWIVLSKSETETELAYDPDPLQDIRFVQSWHTFVSSSTVRDGTKTWTIIAPVESLDRSIAVGVTTSPTNYTTTSSSMKQDGTWLYRLIGGEAYVFNQKEFVGRFGSGLRDDCPVCFAANPLTRQVTAQFRTVVGIYTIVLTTASTDDDFDLLRPCVVLYGTANATMISGT